MQKTPSAVSGQASALSEGDICCGKRSHVSMLKPIYLSQRSKVIFYQSLSEKGHFYPETGQVRRLACLHGAQRSSGSRT
jgi:hypothetical protein